MVYRLPESVEVGPYTFRFQRTVEADSDRQWAFTSYHRRIIGFGLLCNELEMPKSLIHELIHAAADTYGVELDEQKVSALANGLTQALMSVGLLPKAMCLEEEG